MLREDQQFGQSNLDSAAKSSYHRPELIERGDIRQLTQAGFSSGGDAPMTGFLTPTS
ncbi:MAG: hypothetical protein H6510_01445 [Acidobacteria bacterium]|nr:hypothetical protein [Acidobacteriota bacterium]MCB9396455.1 hypothetical protein [Acidobacteriota bacterium]